MKKRQRNKILKIVARQINSGDFSPLPAKHERCVKETMGKVFDRKYVTEFRPWWYEQEWDELDYTTEIRKFFKKVGQEFEELYGLNVEKWKQYVALNREKVA
ncbi:hypothetical protein ACTID9_00935 [Brevibacillus fluminis]|uniref:hypothetical protein n=1 Tax=Brevibacillus fluminis TaxID=511487 RepID=UPI003F8C7D1E